VLTDLQSLCDCQLNFSLSLSLSRARALSLSVRCLQGEKELPCAVSLPE
jgi:hypothetical protein